MKFGKSIAVRAERNQDLRYVNFKLLKTKIKDVVSRLEAESAGHDIGAALDSNRSFEEALSNEIQEVNLCFLRRLEALLREISKISELIDSVGNTEVPCDSEDSSPIWFRELVLMLTRVDRLRKYAVWNAVAVVKILKKRRKKTGFGPEDRSAERACWLAKNRFFNGSDFAELHVAVESLGCLLINSKLTPSGLRKHSCSSGSSTDICDSSTVRSGSGEQCPICLETLVDAVELDCKHRFCWRCFVLGPIAFQPGQYQLTQCPICRRESESSSAGTKYQGILSRFLHKYFPQSAPVLDREQLTALTSEDNDDTEEIVKHLAKIVLADRGSFEIEDVQDSGEHGQLTPRIEGCDVSTPTGSPDRTGASSEPQLCKPHVNDFFSTLPVPQKCPEEMQEMGRVQKLMWIQLAQSGDPYLSTTINACQLCQLCSEPLAMDEVLTTPCKHSFHRICMTRMTHPKCPICFETLPFDYFVSKEHPLADTGFHVVSGDEYKPCYPGGPSQDVGGFLLHSPPPAMLVSAGVQMRSFLHKLPPSACCANDRVLLPQAVDAMDKTLDALSDHSTSSGSGSSSSSEEDPDLTPRASGNEGDLKDAQAGVLKDARNGKKSKKKAKKPCKKEGPCYYSAFGKITAYKRGLLSNSITEDDFCQEAKPNAGQNTIQDNSAALRKIPSPLNQRGLRSNTHKASEGEIVASKKQIAKSEKNVPSVLRLGELV